MQQDNDVARVVCTVTFSIRTMEESGEGSFYDVWIVAPHPVSEWLPVQVKPAATRLVGQGGHTLYAILSWEHS